MNYLTSLDSTRLLPFLSLMRKSKVAKLMTRLSKLGNLTRAPSLKSSAPSSKMKRRATTQVEPGPSKDHLRTLIKLERDL